MKVKDFLTEKNWTKQVYVRVSSTGRKYCLVGAIRFCYPEMNHDIVQKVNDYLLIHYKEYAVVWNDQPEREFKEVKELINILDI